jgi:hypothetical protein
VTQKWDSNPSKDEDLATREIATIREAVMAGYNTTTIGKAFEATFQDPHWEAGETAKGAHFVEFTGMLPKELYKERYTLQVHTNQACLEFLEILKKNPPYHKFLELYRYTPIEELERDDFALFKRYLADPNQPVRQKFQEFYDTEISNAKCGKSPEPEETYAKVTFQWMFSVDRKSFNLTYMDSKPWIRAEFDDMGTISTEKVLAFIYH